MERAMKKSLIIFLVLCVGTIFGQTKVGSTAAPFLNVGIGPRAVSMGGAIAATANDVTALYWNPAGIAVTSYNEALFSHTQWFADITFNWAGAKINLDGLGSIGLSLTYLDYGKMEVTTLREQDGTGEFFGARDCMGLRIGATISNFGTDMRLSGKDLLVLYDVDPNIFGNNDQILASLNTDSYPLPLLFRVGVAMDLLNTNNHKFTIGADALHPNDNAESINVGAEYTFGNFISLRAGYKSLFLRNTEEGLTLGAGVRYDFTNNLGVNFDYAYQDFGLLDYTQHLSVSIRF
jgi:long-subunit fatty acid transport protein